MQLTDAEIDELIRLGGMAPSGGNTQPWKVLVQSDSLELCLHPDRVGSFLDVGHRASILSFGSFIENVCLASTALGLVQRVEIHEFQRLSAPIATIRFLHRTAPGERDPLYEQIPRRHSNRQLHQGPALPAQLLEASAPRFSPGPTYGSAASRSRRRRSGPPPSWARATPCSSATACSSAN